MAEAERQSRSLPLPPSHQNPSPQAGTPAGLSQSHPGTSTPSRAGKCGRGKKHLAAANGLENIRQTPPGALAPFPRPGYFSPRAAAGFAATPWQAEIRLGSVRHLPAPPAPRRAPFAEKTACPPRANPLPGCVLSGKSFYRETRRGTAGPAPKSLSGRHLSLPSCVPYPWRLPRALRDGYKEEKKSTLTRPPSIQLFRI